jgi:phosphatidylserine decarboxylase
MRVAKEGYPIILFTASLSAAAWAIGWSGLAGLLGILALGVLAFFRDPERRPPDGEGLIVAPADGKVVSITKVTHWRLKKKNDARGSLFL